MSDEITPIKSPGPPTLGVVNEDLTITIVRRAHCYNEHYEVDGEKRTVTCKKCKRIVDPIDALLEIAHHPQNLLDETKHLRLQVERLLKETGEARRQRANAIAARKRAESPEATFLRKLAEQHRYATCPTQKTSMDAPCGGCLLCRVRAIVGRMP